VRVTQHIRPTTVGPYIQRVIPDNCADFIVSNDGQEVLVGPATNVDLPSLKPGTTLRGVRLRPHTLRAITGIPGTGLRNRAVAIDDLMSTQSARLLTEALWDEQRGKVFPSGLWAGLAINFCRTLMPLLAHEFESCGGW
jgi:hypothetical protein